MPPGKSPQSYLTVQSSGRASVTSSPVTVGLILANVPTTESGTLAFSDRIVLVNGPAVTLPSRDGLPRHPATPLLGIYPDKTLIQKDTHTPMFIVALFTMAKTWKQPKCPSTDEWIKKMWYIYRMEYYSAIKRMK